MAEHSPRRPSPDEFKVKDALNAANDNILLRAAVIFFIIICLLIPLSFVNTIVTERAELQQEAIGDITARWGRAQQVSGPVLIIPYDRWEENVETLVDPGTRQTLEKKTKIKSGIQFMVVLPKALDIQATINPQERYYGIYRYLVYESPISMTGQFHIPSKDQFGADVANIYFKDAYLAAGISYLRAIGATSTLKWEQAEMGHFSPGTKTASLLGDGFHVDIPLEESFDKNFDFAMNFSLRGSESLVFTPVGEATTIALTGKWDSPSYKGGLSPQERSVSADGVFSASWSISHLTRSYPQVSPIDDYVINDRSEITAFSAGVDLFEPMTLYKQVERAIKYGFLFISLTFITLFGFEIAQKKQLHFLQYALVGVSLCVFYLTLLSLAEHISFLMAFIAASVITVLMNSLYIAAAMKRVRQGVIIAILLTLLYAALYALLSLESFALILGTGLLLVVLAILMFVTRNLPSSGKAA